MRKGIQPLCCIPNTNCFNIQEMPNAVCAYILKTSQNIQRHHPTLTDTRSGYWGRAQMRNSRPMCLVWGLHEGCRNLKRHVLAMRSGSPTHVQRLTVNPVNSVLASEWFFDILWVHRFIVYSFFLSSTFGSSTWGVPNKNWALFFRWPGS